jgi:2-polyprenyl-3-methyl-5-hydroxy-6-metoxy-1,4-benzoquinol methylase
MDDPRLDPRLLEGALRGLRRLNAASMANGHLWRAVSSEARRAGRTIRVLDLACASGDWVLHAAARAAREGLRAEFAGCDVNPHSIELARRRAAAAGLACSFFTHDVVRGGPLDEYDVVTTSLFLHHLGDEEAQGVLASMAAAAGRAVIVNDLVRSRLNLWMVGAASRLLSRSPIVHVDAALSIRAAFTREELRTLADRAGVRGATIGPGGIGRMMLVWRRNA